MTLNNLIQSSNVLFLLLGAIMIFAMHAGFAFLEVGSVRRKNQINALVKILTDWAVSTVVYFLIGFPISYGISFIKPANQLMATDMGFSLVRFFFLLTFAACIPAIISGGIAERAKFWPQVIAGAIFAGVLYPFFESLIWGQNSAVFQSFIKSIGGAEFSDYAGSVVVHSFGGWLALPAILILGARKGRYSKTESHPIPISNVPFLALGSWILAVGWFGFNVMSAQNLGDISGLVAINSLFAMVGGIIVALIISKNDPVFIHNGALAGLVAVCAGSNLYHPLAAFIVGGIASIIFVKGFTIETEVFKVDDVLGVFVLHGLVGSWGGIASGIFTHKIFGGMGGLSFISQLLGTVSAIVVALAGGFLVYFLIDKTIGFRMSASEEELGSDLSTHSLEAYPEESLGVVNSLDSYKENSLNVV
ncbi:ammonium transporter [Orenia metallireducens]|uniref:Ammonium transporter n=1 Tax=Orenia metallireducens TaxID=1413210 RepID=A0A1C0ABH6_9FIRM|nr:ammonium transporter [Orenia metallireducens]OCL27698.1 ammonium transporter [Orenia metallireducens]